MTSKKSFNRDNNGKSFHFTQETRMELEFYFKRSLEFCTIKTYFAYVCITNKKLKFIEF